jgi:hypothetical protein
MTAYNRWIEGDLKWFLKASGEAISADRQKFWNMVQEQTGISKRYAYPQMSDLIKKLLRIEQVSHNVDFQLSIFDLAKINKVEVGESSLRVEIEKIKGLEDLQLNVKVERTVRYSTFSILQKTFPLIDIEVHEDPTQSHILPMTIKTPLIFPFDNIEVELIHRNSALTLYRTNLNAPLNNVVEPFYNVLAAFCSPDKFEEMLLNPKDFKNAPEKIFENAVAWLLSLAGFHIIYLGANSKATKTEFEKLRKYGKYDVGSADIIAYEDNERILLVDCDLSGLDETKIRKLIELTEHLRSSCEYEDLKFMPIIFTPKYLTEKMKKVAVGVVDGYLIENILKDLAKGDRERARWSIQYYP